MKNLKKTRLFFLLLNKSWKIYQICCFHIEFIVIAFIVWGEIFWLVVAISVKEFSLTILTIPKKLDKKFIITKNSVDQLPVRSLIEKVNTKWVVLNIYFMVGVNTISSGNVFFEIANNYFSVYIYFVQIYLRTFFNLLILVTELVSDTYLSEQAERKKSVGAEKKLLKRFYFLITVNVVKNF